MGRIQSSDDFEPEERDYFANWQNEARQKTDNLGDMQGVQHKLGERMKELEGTRFVEVLTTLIEREIFR